MWPRSGKPKKARPCRCLFWCHHRSHLHVAIRLETKESMPSDKGGPDCRNRSLNGVPLCPGTQMPISFPTPTNQLPLPIQAVGMVGVLRGPSSISLVVIIKHNHLHNSINVQGQYQSEALLASW